MRAQRAAVNLAVVLVSVFGIHSQAQGQAMTCQTANFSEAVRAKMPSIRKSCLEITQHDGAPSALMRATVTRVHDNGVEVRFLMPDGTQGDRRFIETNPDLEVLVGGSPTRVHDLAVGQELTAYIKVAEPVFELAQPPTAAPVPVEAKELPPAPPEPATHLAREMPRTGGPIPLIALIGATLLALSGVLRGVLRGG